MGGEDEGAKRGRGGRGVAFGKVNCSKTALGDFNVVSTIKKKLEGENV